MFKLSEIKVFITLFILAITILTVLFIFNLFSDKNGTYTDHTQTMWDLFWKKYDAKEPESALSPEKENKKSFESKGEVECRRAIEAITGKPFPKARPPFLRNSVSGSTLELDCYCDELKLAVEYNGEQHYKYIPYFHQNKEAFYNLKYRDEMKQRLCHENGVQLIIVPYTIPLHKIKEFIELNMAE